MIRKYLFYLIRWQLSTPILAPIVAYFKHSPSAFGTREDWIATSIANLIGGLIFFWVDRFIFSPKFDEVWDAKENVVCVDCGMECRGYRLIRRGKYDKTQAKPEFRCESCSIKKYHRVVEQKQQ
jgi:hypothetical protein